jgi:hypothetical protein
LSRNATSGHQNGMHKAKEKDPKDEGKKKE